MRIVPASKMLCGALALVCVLGGAACQQGAVTVETNTNATNANATTNTNATSSPTPSVTLAAREPERYRATLAFTVEAQGKQPQALPPLQVARDGDNRRYAINLPAIGEAVFLDRADKRYLILTGRKQYVELNQQTTGFDVRSLTPGQMVARLQQQPGVQLVGDDQLNGRSVTKYRYSATAKTTTQAGDVHTDNFIYVDKDTGLPLRVEGYGQSTGNVQGVNSGRLVAEMKDISTDVDPTLFDLPTGYAQITQEQIKQQMVALAAIFQAVMSTINAQANANAPAPTTASPAATSASPAPSIAPSVPPGTPPQ
ncbi:MAG: hypothetical protein DMF64_10345 [Acidobacteria bacterium]|nr:MAG: hypothetical protein DMF64_10345 [Acidobacteriota bacterium]